ncbi:hypothetical protein C7431_11128 [Pantoea allii]|uniref:Uncharacterized protein n=1 Tax=Pantoea allii TaxID=574096 RepID=A0A2V2BD32_9GAMM|nr:hypothetical protein [Pantoea allii]PWK94293.1 hypothetical protein C7431_11128 [Pantoea allii]
MINFFLNEAIWKTLGTVIPVMAPVIRGLWLFYVRMKEGPIYKLKKMDNEYKNYLGEEERTLLKKRIRAAIGTRLCGVSNPLVKRRLMYVQNRTDIHLPSPIAGHIGKFLEEDGKRFYFKFTSKAFRRKRLLYRFFGAVYFIYGVMFFATFLLRVGENTHPWWMVPVSSLFFIFAIIFFILTPSDKAMQGMNGKLLNIDMSAYRKRE